MPLKNGSRVKERHRVGVVEDHVSLTLAAGDLTEHAFRHGPIFTDHQPRGIPLTQPQSPRRAHSAGLAKSMIVADFVFYLHEIRHDHGRLAAWARQSNTQEVPQMTLPEPAGPGEPASRRDGPPADRRDGQAADQQRPAGPQPGLASSPLREVHERLGATLVAFAGWLMPLRYASEIAEHNAVRRAAGLFDLSHMGEISVTGEGAAAALDYALTGQLSTLAPGRARYTMICAPDGGVLDDLVVYRLADAEYLVVANAANAAVVHGELTERAAATERMAGAAVTVTDVSAQYALIAIQGPAAAAILSLLTDAPLADLKYYASMPAVVGSVSVLLARTGYTGEDGFELFCRPADAVATWTALQEAGSQASTEARRPGDGTGLLPAGLAARDTLRLEAGMPLYGNELSGDVTPFEAGLGRVVKFDKPGDFVGRAALAERAQAGPRQTLIGLTGRTRRIPRHGYPVLLGGEVVGTVTSGAPSPTLGRPIAMAYVRPEAAEAARGAGEAGSIVDGLAVDVRGHAEPADYAELPFYRRAR
jgi:glycine cleavage system T protein (aminomethyltransferase)